MVIATHVLLSNYLVDGLHISNGCPEHKQTRLSLKVNMEPAETSPPPSSMLKAAKVGHKKSRLGCQRCKTRRVKVCLPYSVMSMC